MVLEYPRLFIVATFFTGLIGGVCGSFLADSSVVAQPGPSTEPDTPSAVAAQEFRLVDDRGRVRALLSFSEEGEPFLHLRDQNDTHRVWMGISNDTGVVVRDTDGKTRLVLSLDAQGEPSLVVRDRQHRTKSFHP
ncbi:hypothetical protein YTPLAS18_29910 [Nitrospira sp.]|nr:hypothetical protein YTPLAS18_29910 [Nitrospira sp.]